MSTTTTMKVFVGFVCLFHFIGGASAAPVQWPVSEGGNDHWYEAFAVPGSISWGDARTAAQALGPEWDLATTTSAEENTFVFDLIDDSAFWFPVGNGYHGPWLGGFSSSPSSNDWQWVTGETWAYTNWAPEQPASDGAYLHYFNESNTTPADTWNDQSPFLQLGYIAELPEPSALSLLVIGSLLVTRRWR